MSLRRARPLLIILTTALLAGCFGTKPSTPPNPLPVLSPTPHIGLALGGGAAKGFAHIGVIKMLEASGIHVDVVSGTSAGSVVGAMYASGMDAFALQQQAFSLDESKIRDVRLFSGGLVQGQKLEDYVNELVHHLPIEKLRMPFAAVATELETGERAIFVRGNTGQAVRASSSIPGVFEPVAIGGKHFVDGGVVSPVPVDAARQLGANIVIAVDISSKPSGSNPDGMMGIVGQSITIMGKKLAEQELSRADIVIRPKVGTIGPTDFDQKNVAILEGERAALAAIPAIRAKIAEKTAAMGQLPAPAH
ncbi:NTE family protein [Luteibacter sp. Sphag1AF]|uniref:patatin-like phospholipase family protein n=1 Tax=Luteibacter sp. Sphag1AF TaxID=2587031 RepID=UPI0016192C23|nr:patatin-like phospholipase family protein [Luteibacter sp. Sphag1AF]MBB3226591.1 NTE family protein [Luteibacter sp. Sphag1AF]